MAPINFFSDGYLILSADYWNNPPKPINYTQ